jgi:hypothetical protein
MCLVRRGGCDSGRGGRSDEISVVSDHPVCGAKVGLRRNFLDAAATPPHEEGNASSPKIKARPYTSNSAQTNV